MSAQPHYITSILKSFNAFVAKLQLDTSVKESALLFMLAFLEQKHDFNFWSVNEITKYAQNHSIQYRHGQEAGRVLIQFVSQYPPYQTTVFLHEFLLALKNDGCSYTTLKNYRSDIQQFIRFSDEKSLKSLITKPKLSAFLKQQAQKGLKPASIKRKLASINQFALWAQREGLVQQSLGWLKKLNSLNQETLTTLDQPTSAFVSRLTENKRFSKRKSIPHDPSLSNLDNQPRKRRDAKSKARIHLEQPQTDSTNLRAKIKHLWHLFGSKRNLNKQKPSFVALPTNFLGKKIAKTSARKTQDFRSRLDARLVDLNQKMRYTARKQILPYLNLALIGLFVLGLGVFGYRQFKTEAPASLAYPSSLTRPNRSLSFQGRLTDTAQNPITSATNMQFRLYDTGPGTGGNLLWDSGTCSVTPDQDGIFSVNLGSDCGSEIAASVFSEHSNVWLEVQTGTETLTPRQPIKTVAYALNAETLQGYPASASAVENTVLVMDNNGEVVLGNANPKLKATGDSFSLEAQTITLDTPSGSDGDINLSPDGLGKVKVNSDLILDGYLEGPGATLSANYSTGTALTLKSGPSSTADIMRWKNSSGSTLGVIDHAGNIGIGTTAATQALEVAGNIYANAGQIRLGNFASSPTAIGAGSMYYDSTAAKVYYYNGTTWAEMGGGGSSYWQRNAGILAPLTTSDALVLGGATTTDHLLEVSGAKTGKALAVFNETGDQNILVASASGSPKFVIDRSGNVGIGTTEPGTKFDVSGGNIKVSSSHGLDLSGRGINLGSGLVPNGLRFGTNNGDVNFSGGGTVTGATGNLTLRTTTSGDILFSPVSASNAMVVKATSGNVGIGTTSPSGMLSIVSNSAATPALLLESASSPTADYMQIRSNGSTNGDILTVDSSGRVGIGTTSPGTTLDVLLSDGVDSGVSTVARFAHKGNTPATGMGSAIDIPVYNTSGVVLDGIRLEVVNADAASNYPTFSIKQATNGTSYVQRMKITKAGLVGFGNSDIDASLNYQAGVGTSNTNTTAGAFNAGLILANNSATKGNGTDLISAYNGYKMAAISFKTDAHIYGRSILFMTNPGGGLSERMRIDNVSGNVGIGTTSPATRFEVNSTSTQMRLAYDNSNYQDFTIQSDGSLYIDQDGGGTEFSLTNGRLGIGTTSPSSALDVGGGSYAHVNGAGDVGVAGDLEVLGTIYGNVNVTGGTFDTINTDFLKVNRAATMSATIASDIPLKVYGVSGQSADLVQVKATSSATPSFVIDANGQVGITPSTDSTSTLNVTNSAGTSVLNVDTTNGRVGIGTSSPQAPLHIVSTSSDELLKLTRYAPAIYLNSNAPSNARDFLLQSVNSNNGYFRIFDQTAGTEPFKIYGPGVSNTLVINQGNVGIGTTNPIDKLHVYGSADIYDTVYYRDTNNWLSRVTSNGGSTGTLYDIGTVWDTNGSGALALGNAFGLVGYNYATVGTRNHKTAITVDSAGNVGIGTTGPGAKLEVYGGKLKINGLSTSSTVIDLSSIDDAVIQGAGTNTQIRMGGNLDLNANSLTDFATGGTSKMRLQNSGGLSLGNSYVGTDPGAGSMIISGNVGIGTTGPGSRLSFGTYNTTYNNTKSLRLYELGSTVYGFGISNNLMEIHADQSSGQIGLFTNSTERVRLTASGSVGIGTTSPSSALDVGGGSYTHVNGAGDVGVAGDLEVLGTIYGNVNVTGGTFDTINTDFLKVNRAATMSATIASDIPLKVYGVSGQSADLVQVKATSSATPSFVIDANGQVGITPSTDSTSTLNVTNSAGTSVLNVDTTNGRVGIGTTNPDSPLHIQVLGDGYIQRWDRNGVGSWVSRISNGSPAVNTLRLYPSTAGAFKLQDSSQNDVFVVNVGSGETWLAANGGNVGIGTTATGALLHVKKDQNASTLIKVENTTDGTAAEVGFSGIGDKSFSLIGYPDTYSALPAFAGEVILDSSGAPVGLSSLGDEIKFYGGGRTDSDIRMIIKNGNVGIGTTNPKRNLQVVSGSTSNDGLSIANSDFDANSIGSELALFHGASSGNTYSRIQAYTAGRTAAGNLVLQQSGGNVGIGTTSPVAKLDVADGNILLSTTGKYVGLGNYDKYIPGDTANSGLYGRGNVKFVIDSNNDQTDRSFFWQKDANTLASGTTIMSLNEEGTLNLGSGNLYVNGTSGNVGIGTTAPVGKLNVEGAVTGKALTILNETGDQDILVASKSGTTKFVIDHTGNVGIGSDTTPDYKLDVQGTFRADSAASFGSTIYSPSIGAGTDNSVVILNSSGYLKTDEIDPKVWGTALVDSNGGITNYVTKWTTGGETIGNSIIYDNGTNVGIGTTSPTAKLHVSGDLKLLSGTNVNNIKTTVGATGDDNSLVTEQGIREAIAAGSSIGGGWTDDGSVVRLTTSSDKVGIGTTAPVSKLAVEGAVTGKALTILNETGDQNILVASASGTPKFVIDHSGNVGIGTTLPQSKLSVAGGAGLGATYAGVTAPTNGLIVEGQTGIGTTSPSGMLHILSNSAATPALLLESASSPTADYMQIRSNGATSGDILTVDSSGRVGIGTTNPSEKLTVEGDIKINTAAPHFYLMENDVTSNNYRLMTSGGEFFISEINDDKSVVGHRFAIDPSGNIGIGTTGPSELLSLAGATGVAGIDVTPSGWTVKHRFGALGTSGAVNYISSNYEPNGGTVDSSSYGTAQITTTAGGSGGAISLSTGAVNTAPTAKINIESDGDVVLQPTSGNVGIGTTAPVGKLNVEGAVTGKALTILNETGDQDILVASKSGTTKFVIDNSGNVGIGTTSPDYALDIAGSAALSITGSKYLRFRQSDGTVNGLIGYTSSTGNLQMTDGTGGIYLHTGNVGIGSTGPTQKLDVAGIVRGDAFYDRNNGAYFLDPASGSISLTTAGNVGIGTTSPSVKLDVRGPLSDSANGFAYNLMIHDSATATQGVGGGIGFSGNADAPRTFAVIQGIHESITASDYAGALRFLTRPSGGNPTERMRIDSSGNVGIGTTAPGAKLEVSGDIKGTGEIYEDYKGVTFTDNTPRWVRFAQSSSSGVRNSGVFEIRWARSGKHGHVRFAVGADYGYDAGIGITVLDSSAYVGGCGKIRILMKGTNDQMYLEFYDEIGGTTTYPINYYIYKYSGWGWSLVTPTTGSVPSDYANYEMPANIIFGARSDSNDIFIFNRSGNVGIGTASPIDKLNVSVAGGKNGLAVLNSSGDRRIQLFLSSASGSPGQFYLANGSGSNVVKLAANSDQASYIDAGNVGINDSTPSYRLDVNGTLRAYGITDSSDIRLKKDITPLQNALRNILQLQGVNYYWKDAQYGSGLQLGFIAQDVEKIVPEAVTTANDGYKGIEYGKLTALLAEGVKELASNLTLDDAGNIVLQASSSGYLVRNTADNSLISQISAFAQSIIGQVQAGLISTQELIVNETAQIANLQVNQLIADNITIDGQTLADYINQIIDQRQSVIVTTSSNGSTATIAAQLTADQLDLDLLTSQTATISSLTTTKLVTHSLVVKGTSKLGSLLAENATISGQLVADSARVHKLKAEEAQFDQVTATMADLTTATVSGTLYADNIDQLDKKIATAFATPSLVDLLKQKLGLDQSASASADIGLINNQAASTASASALLDQSLADLNLDENATVISADAAFIDQYFKVNGSAYVAQSLGIGNQLFVYGQNQIVQFGANFIAFNARDRDQQPALFVIQPSGEGMLALMGQTLIIDGRGEVTVNANLTVAGNLKVKQTLLANLIQPADFGNPFQIQIAGLSTQSGQVKQSRFEIVDETGAAVATISAQGKAQFAGGIGVASDQTSTNQVNIASGSAVITSEKTAGRAVLPAGATQLTIENNQVDIKSLVYLTPSASTNNQVLYVAHQTAYQAANAANQQTVQLGSFTVNLDQPLNHDLPFNWWIVN